VIVVGVGFTISYADDLVIRRVYFSFFYEGLGRNWPLLWTHGD
jgi:hypothetical protein